MSLNNPFWRDIARALRGGSKLVVLCPVAKSEFAPTAALFAALVVLDLILVFAFSLVAFGLDGRINPYELPRELMFVPLALAAGMVARRVDPDTDLLLLPVALAAANLVMTAISWILYLLAQRQFLPFAETYWSWFDEISLVWSALIVFLAGIRLVGRRILPRLATGVAAIALIIIPAVWLPEGMLWVPRADANAAYGVNSFHTLADEQAFYAQQGALARELSRVEAQRRGVPDLYVVSAGLYAGEDVFMKDVKMMTGLFRDRFDAAGRIVTLINNPKTVEEYPIASLTSISESLTRVGKLMNRDEDVLVLYISSHGSDKHELVVDFRPLRLTSIDPPRLKTALEQSGIRWKVIVISACYSGGFVEPLKNPYTLIITASSADRQSFGCGSESDSTYLARALFAQALTKTFSFETAFEEARKSIEQWEREKGYTPSQPQIYVGAEIRGKLAQVERRLASLPARER